MKKKFIRFILIVLLVFPISGQKNQKNEIISIIKTPYSVSVLKSFSFDLIGEIKEKIYIHASPPELSIFQNLGITYDIETPRFLKNTKKDFAEHDYGGINGPYHTYQEVETELSSLEKDNPSLARLFVFGKSLENRNLYALKISDNVQSDESEAEVLLIGCHHAREWISVEVPLLIAKYLLENYSQDNYIHTLVDESEIWIIPLLNPDGLEYSIHYYRYWRKNRRDNEDGTFGVDLNRNYGYQWGCDEIGSSSSTSSDIFRGLTPYSEPEVQAVIQLFQQRDFQTLISYHSYSQIILFPWGYTDYPAVDTTLLLKLSENMSKLMQSVNGRAYKYGQAGDSLYFTNGDMTDWAYGVYGIPAFTIELPPVDQLGGGFFNAEQDIDPIFRENLPAALYLIEWAVENYAAGDKRQLPPLKRHQFRNLNKSDTIK